MENIKKVVRIKKLKHIKLKELRLFCCNAGLKDEKNNVARTFKKTIMVAKLSLFVLISDRVTN